MDISQFTELPIMGILRGVKAGHIEPLAEAVVSSGLKTIEITMNTPGAPSLIEYMVRSAKGRLIVGAGTVLCMRDMRSAIDAGASFIVMPTFDRNIVEFCVKKKIPVFPGAATPQEIHTAWNAGASMVKLFPAKFFGPEYIREIKAPLESVRIMACGGINAKNIRSYFDCGASAVAFGASIFKKEWLEKGDFSSIESRIEALIDAYNG